MLVLFRELTPESLNKALARERVPIDGARAQAQHAAYAAAITKALPSSAQTVTLPADAALPDACFVEDTAVLLKPGVVVLTRPPPSRLVSL